MHVSTNFPQLKLFDVTTEICYSIRNIHCNYYFLCRNTNSLNTDSWMKLNLAHKAQ